MSSIQLNTSDATELAEVLTLIRADAGLDSLMTSYGSGMSQHQERRRR
jgi:hypothetical protein